MIKQKQLITTNVEVAREFSAFVWSLVKFMTGLDRTNGRHAVIQAYFSATTSDNFFLLYQLTVLNSPRRLKRLNKVMKRKRTVFLFLKRIRKQESKISSETVLNVNKNYERAFR